MVALYERLVERLVPMNNGNPALVLARGLLKESQEHNPLI